MVAHTVWLNLAVFATGLTGFVLLALASERQGEALLQRVPSNRERLMWRSMGWPLLMIALALCIFGWGWSIGPVALLGWLCMAGTVLVFTLSGWTEKKSVKQIAPSVLQAPSRSTLWRALACMLLVGGPIAFMWALSVMPAKPVLRADAVQGQAGPWPFTLAEIDHNPPRVVVRDLSVKTFQVRFCDTCDTEIRAAYLKVHKPRSLRGAGIEFIGSRWDRFVEIQLPGNTRANSELWLTVEGKDGSVHQTSVRMHDIAPTTAQWFEARREK